MNENKEKVWERLKYVPEPEPATFDFDVNSMYMAGMNRIFTIKHVEWKEGDNVTIKVLKSR